VEISERLSKFHKAGYIFADMRVGNVGRKVVFGKEHGFIIDARPGNWMSSDHDTDRCLRMWFEVLFLCFGGDGFKGFCGFRMILKKRV
jgi:hypothetical protein